MTIQGSPTVSPYLTGPCRPPTRPTDGDCNERPKDGCLVGAPETPGRRHGHVSTGGPRSHPPLPHPAGRPVVMWIHTDPTGKWRSVKYQGGPTKVDGEPNPTFSLLITRTSPSRTGWVYDSGRVDKGPRTSCRKLPLWYHRSPGSSGSGRRSTGPPSPSGKKTPGLLSTPGRPGVGGVTGVRRTCNRISYTH